jgi:hypothetical protein
LSLSCYGCESACIRQDGSTVAEHRRSFDRGETVYDPWHYVPVLARKPGALRNGAPFKDWVLPSSMERVRSKLKAADDGNRQMVDILTAVLTDGLPAVEAACAEALQHITTPIDDDPAILKFVFIQDRRSHRRSPST